jgi:hypothetical protein
MPYKNGFSLIKNIPYELLLICKYIQLFTCTTTHPKCQNNSEMIQARGNAITSNSNQEGNGTTTSTIDGEGNGKERNGLELEITHLKVFKLFG